MAACFACNKHGRNCVGENCLLFKIFPNSDQSAANLEAVEACWGLEYFLTMATARSKQPNFVEGIESLISQAQLQNENMILREEKAGALESQVQLMKENKSLREKLRSLEISKAQLQSEHEKLASENDVLKSENERLKEQQTDSIHAQQHQTEVEQLKAINKEVSCKLFLREIVIVDLNHLLSKQEKDGVKQKQEWDAVKTQHHKWLADEKERCLARQKQEFEKAKAEGNGLAIVPWYPVAAETSAKFAGGTSAEFASGTSAEFAGGTSAEFASGTSAAAGNMDDFMLDVSEMFTADDPIEEFMKNYRDASGKGKGI